MGLHVYGVEELHWFKGVLYSFPEQALWDSGESGEPSLRLHPLMNMLYPRFWV